MLAVCFGLKAHKNLASKMHVKVLVHNTTVRTHLMKWEPAVSIFKQSYQNYMGLVHYK